MVFCTGGTGAGPVTSSPGVRGAASGPFRNGFGIATVGRAASTGIGRTNSGVIMTSSSELLRFTERL